ncbi:MAG: MFS transporter [Pseudomonadota bacterium]
MKSLTPELKKHGAKTASLNPAIVGLIAANIAFVLELTLVPLLLPEIQTEFGLSIEQLSWVFNSYGVSVAVGVIFGGLSGDSLNTQKVFCCGVFAFAAGAFTVAFANSYEMLILGRVLQGVGGGIFLPLVPLLITRISPHRPGRALILWGSIAGYIAAFAPFVYANAFRQYGWEVAIILNASVAVIALAVTVVAPDAEETTPTPGAEKDYSAFLHAHHLWLTYGYIFCTYGSITFFLFFLPVWLTDGNVSAARIGSLLSSLWLTYSVVSALLRGFVDGPQIKPIMLVAPFLIAAGIPVLLFDTGVAGQILASILVGAGLACSNSPSTQLVIKFAPKGMSAVATSMDITFARLGGIVTVAILAESATSQAATLIGALCFISACCTLVVGRKL